MRNIRTSCGCIGVIASCLLAVLFGPVGHAAESPRRHVVVIVCDGLRPDSVTPDDMPTLYELARQGTTFSHHHPVYLSSTEVNGTALATGTYPRHSGIMANNEYRPDVELLKPFGTEEIGAVRKADSLTGGHYLNAPTVAEIVRHAGFRTVVAGTKGVALLLDRSERTVASPARDSVAIVAGQGLADTAAKADETPGQFPKLADATKSANRNQDAWTTRILIDRLWAGEIPAFTTLWFSEPDFAQHGSGPGSAVARAALRSDDDDIAAVLKAIDAAGAADITDVMVVSDHGFSTIEKTVDVYNILSGAGFDATLRFAAAPKDGQILVVPNGGSFSLYVIGHDRQTISKLVRFLQRSDFAGVIFTRGGADGTFPLDAAGVQTPDAPDILVSMRWDDKASGTGMPGMLFCNAVKYGPGQGYHASLSRYDMHNTLIASGPDFRRGFVDEMPTGNIDVAPTALALLGIAQPEPMDGRVLSEALAAPHSAPAIHPRTETIEAGVSDNSTHWRQYLRVSRVGATTYYDEGNAGAGSETAISTTPAAETAVPQTASRDWSAAPAIVHEQTTQDVYAMGDVHGDYQVMARLLAGAKLIKSATAPAAAIEWTGDKSVLVCTGDLLDKYDHAIDVIAALRSLQTQAKNVGGRVLITMGNHEADFLAEKAKGNGKAKAKKPKTPEEGAKFTDELIAAGMKPEEVLAGSDSAGIGQFLRNLPIAAEVNDFFFCHAGNTHGKSLASLETELQTEIDAHGFGAPILSDPDSMIEARIHPVAWWEADGGSGKDMGEQWLRNDVAALGAAHLVFGHQPGKAEFADGTTRKKGEIFSKFNGLIFLIDTGMSRGAGAGHGEVLRIHRNGPAEIVTAIDSDGKTEKVWSSSK